MSNLRNPGFVKHALLGVDLVGAFRAQDPTHVRAGMIALRRRRLERLPVRAPADPTLLAEFVRSWTGPLTPSNSPLGQTGWKG